MFLWLIQFFTEIDFLNVITQLGARGGGMNWNFTKQSPCFPFIITSTKSCSISLKLKTKDAFQAFLVNYSKSTW